jgi:hypothetical protein
MSAIRSAQRIKLNGKESIGRKRLNEYNTANGIPSSAWTDCIIRKLRKTKENNLQNTFILVVIIKVLYKNQ